MKKKIATVCSLLAGLASLAAPVAVDWKPSETLPTKVARPFCGYLPNGEFLVAGGSDFVDGKKVYRADVTVRGRDGQWRHVGHFPRPIAEAACCETPLGVFGAGGTDGNAIYNHAAILTGDGQRRRLPDLPEPMKMGAAACDGKRVYVVASKRVYALDLELAAAQGRAALPSAAAQGSASLPEGGWQLVAELPGAPREQHVAAIQNGDQKEKRLIVYGGYEVESKMPLNDGWAIDVTEVGRTRDKRQETRAAGHETRDEKEKTTAAVGPSPFALRPRQLAPLPPQVTTIGAAFLPSGHQHVLLAGGFGWHGWIDRAVKGKVAGCSEVAPYQNAVGADVPGGPQQRNAVGADVPGGPQQRNAVGADVPAARSNATR